MPDRAAINTILGALAALAFMANCGVASCAQSTPVEPAVDDPAPAAPSASPVTDASPYAVLRKPAVAGSWYPGEERALAAEVDEMLDAAPRGDCDALPMAIGLPHAGYRFSGATAARAVAQVRDCTVRRVWVLGVSHHVGIEGVGLYAVDAFRTPLGDLPLDRATLERLATREGFQWLDAGRKGAGDLGEHSIEIELPLLQRALGAFELMPLLVGDLDPALAREVAAAIRPELGPGDLVVISGDYTHYGPNYGYVPFKEQVGEQLDQLDHGAWDLVRAGDTDGLAGFLRSSGATICGRHTNLLFTALMDDRGRGRELAYTTSGALTGDWTNSVSYLAARFDGPGWSGTGPSVGGARLVSAEAGSALRDLAEEALRHHYEEGTPLQVDPAKLPAGSDKVLGAFVTLEKDHQLRGCIGEIVPRRPAWEAVAEHALDAALRDRRFRPVTRDELGEITVEVSLLGPSWQVRGPQDFIIGRHGIVLSLEGRQATYLPQVAPEQGWDRGATLVSLARKAGIPSDRLGEATIEVYEAQVVHPPAPAH